MSELAQWASNVKWSEYVVDDEVTALLTKLKARIESYGGDGETRIKLVAVGDGAVGKTSLLIAFAKGTFPDTYVPTVFENYTASIQSGDRTVLLHLWDTAGQEDYDRLRPLSYPGADIVLLCFSLVTESSFESVKEKWSPEVEHYVPDVPTILVGTKADLRDSKTPDPSTGEFAPVSDEQVNSLVKEINARAFIPVSAKTGTNLPKVFDQAVAIVLQHRRDLGEDDGPAPSPSTPSDGDGIVFRPSTTPANRRGGCVLI